ncbi:MAG: hypothetical protein ACRBB2_07745 [Nitrosopumilus sp.]
MNIDHKIFGGIITVIMIIAVAWSASILLTPTSNPSDYEFLTEEQVKTIKELESLCSGYSASSKLSCINTIESEITRYQIDGASDKAIKLQDVSICHLISSDVECLMDVAKRSNDKNACFEITNSHQQIEDSEEKNLKYLESIQSFCLSRYISS